jgi:hypothetical protein
MFNISANQRGARIGSPAYPGDPINLSYGFTGLAEVAGWLAGSCGVGGMPRTSSFGGLVAWWIRATIQVDIPAGSC